MSKVSRLVSLAWERTLDEVFPPWCVSCKRYGAFVCEECGQDAEPAVSPRCRVCWSPSDADKCAECSYRKPPFAGVRAVFSYGGSVRDMVLALKFESVSALAPLMGERMASVMADWSPPVKAIMPVPLSGARKRERGFDQSELLSREVSRRSGLPLLTGTLVRVRDTRPQARARLDEESRRKNVEDAFAVRGRTPAPGVLLIDDVITTGATLAACARVLLDAGAGPVYCLTFARED